MPAPSASARAPVRQAAHCHGQRPGTGPPVFSGNAAAVWPDRCPSGVVGDSSPIMEAPVFPCHRCCRGDVGSGKTVVAALAINGLHRAGWRCALMAPTEILAETAFPGKPGRLAGTALAPLGKRSAWRWPAPEEEGAAPPMLALVESGEAALVVEHMPSSRTRCSSKNLALAVIDEQHRFGVASGWRFGKASRPRAWSHILLMMSATRSPVPWP